MSGWWKGARAVLRGPARTRFGPAALSAVAAAGFSPWARSTESLGPALAELVLCVFAWEASMALGRRVGAHWLGRAVALEGLRAGPSTRLALRVLAASVPATGVMMAVFYVAGERVASPASVYGQSLALGLLIAFARRGLRPARPAAAPSGAPVALPVAPPVTWTAAAFLHRYAPRLAHHRLLAIQAEDHYVRLHTEGATALVLMRFTDAVAAFGPEAGWRPHRSFWVAAGAPATARRHGQGWKLTLSNGLVVPVSRNNLGALRAAGYGDRPG